VSEFRWLIRNQQVVGSNPTGGSRKSSKHKALKVHFGGHSVDLLRIVREMSEFGKERLDFLVRRGGSQLRCGRRSRAGRGI
jgi:hypothetical protein